MKNRYRIVLSGIFCIFVIFIVFAFQINNQKRVQSSKKVISEAYYLIDDKWCSAESVDIKKVKRDDLTMKFHLSKEMKEGESILFQLRSGNVVMRVNEDVVYTKQSQLTSKDAVLFSSEWCIVDNDNLSPEDDIFIEMKGKNANIAMQEMIHSLCVGNVLDVLRTKLLENALEIGISLIIMIIAVAYIITFYTLHGVRAELSLNYVACALLLLSGAVCALIDYDYITFIIPDINLLNTIDYLSQCFIGTFLLIYLQIFFKTKEQIEMVRWFVGIWCCSVPIYFLLLYKNMRIETSYISMQMICFAVIFIIVLIQVCREYRKKLPQNVRLLLASSVLLAVTLLMELVHYYLTSVYWIIIFQMGLLIFAIVQFSILLNDAKEKFLLAEEVEKRSTENRIEIMLSQIQPHFLYNALNTIQYLCETNPAKASETIGSFAGYLRGNMDSLSYKEPIPFLQEIEHLKQYLKIEQQRFENVKIEYDLKTVDFMLPALTIQPLVENSIKYGVARKECGGTVKVSTWEDEKYWCVKVEDDGIGFDPLQVQYDGRSHIGIKNTRERLASMSHGVVKISSEPDVGTSVLLMIPKEKNNHDSSSD